MFAQQSINRDDSSKVKRRGNTTQRRYNPLETAVQQILQGPVVQIAIVILVGAYTFLQFALILLQDLLTEDQMTQTTSQLSWLELFILITFLLEIVLSSYAWGIKRYFKDRWLGLDFLIILLSIFFVIFQMATQSRVAKNVFSVIQILFRFLRILLLIRKAQSFKRIKNVSSIKTPAEKIIDFFLELKDICEDIDMKLDIEYCIDKIASNKLYEPVYLLDDDADAADWIKYGATKNIDEAPTIDTHKQTQGMSLARVKPKVLELLRLEHDDLYIDPFELHKASPQGVVDLMVYLFAEYQLLETLSVTSDCFVGYFVKVWEGYRDNPYHSKVHSFDVTQSTSFFVNRCKLGELAALSKSDMACLYIAAAIHDYDHPGFNNAYMVNSKSKLTLLYNDKSVLESYHVSAAFKLMNSFPEFNIFGQLSKENYKKMRESVIGIVLATDMAGHFAEIAKLKSRLSSRWAPLQFDMLADFDLKGKDKQMVMEMIVHACDISNPIKGFDVYREWTERLFREFSNQGDMERQAGLPISYLCDRYTTNLAKAQSGFIDFVVRPMMSLLTQVLPEFEPYYQNLDTNKAKWGELVDHYEQKLEQLKAAQDP